MTTLTRDELFLAARNMQSYGGSFAAAIAEAYYRADSHNQRILTTAFADLFERFAPTPTEGETT